MKLNKPHASSLIRGFFNTNKQNLTKMKRVKQLAKEAYKADLDMVIILGWFLYQYGVIL